MTFLLRSKLATRSPFENLASHPRAVDYVKIMTWTYSSFPQHSRENVFPTLFFLLLLRRHKLTGNNLKLKFPNLEKVLTQELGSKKSRRKMLGGLFLNLVKKTVTSPVIMTILLLLFQLTSNPSAISSCKNIF
jgi:hypothetical protein